MKLGGRIRVHVLRVIDGDSLIVQRTGGVRRQFELRLHGIDAPEYEQEFYDEAAGQLRSLALNRTFYLNITEPSDYYDRVVGVLYEDTPRASLNHLMLSLGLAYNWPKYGVLRGGKEVQTEARLQRLGVWRDPGGGPRPWKHRSRRRNRQPLQGEEAGTPPPVMPTPLTPPRPNSPQKTILPRATQSPIRSTGRKPNVFWDMIALVVMVLALALLVGIPCVVWLAKLLGL